MRIAAKEGNARHMAAPNPHPDWAALGMTFGFMRKNVNNNRQLNPGSPYNRLLTDTDLVVVILVS